MKTNKVWGIASLVCGVLSILLILMPYFGLPLAILAIVGAYKQNSISKIGLATAGNVTGIIGVVLNSVMLIIVLFGLLIISAIWGR